MQKLKKICLILLLAMLAFKLAGCNTFYGFGEDVEAGGKAIKNAAE